MSNNTILASAPLTATGYHLKATGTALGQSLIWDNGTNVGIGNTNTSYTLDVSGTGRFSGNLGLSTLQTWSSGQVVLQVSNASLYNNGASNSYFGNNYYLNSGGSVTYLTTSSVGVLGQEGNSLVYYNAPSGTAGTTVSLTERFRITSTGNVGIGTSSPLSKLTVWTPTTQSNAGVWSNCEIALHNSTSVGDYSQIGLGYAVGTTNAAAYIGLKSTSAAANGKGDLVFGTRDVTTDTAPTERMRITSGGTIEATSNSTTAYSLTLSTTQATSPNIVRFYSATDTNNTNQFIMCDAAASVQRMSVRTNGGIYNYTTNNVVLSDERLKKDIIPLESVWNKVKGIEIVKYKFKDQSHDDFNMGVIAQQVELIAPELIDLEGFGTLAEDGTPYKGIYESDIHYYSIKALQECMSKIEEQQATITSLQEQITELKQIVATK